MNKYTKLFLKNRLLLIFVVGTLFFLLFFFVLLFNKNAIYPPAFALWIYVPGVVWFAIDVLLTIRFRKLIRYQEEFLNISFNDQNAAPLFPRFLTYLSDDWVIFSGKTAFHREFIEKVTIRPKHASTGGNNYILKIKTRTGRSYKRVFGSHADARDIQHWFKNSQNRTSSEKDS